MSYYYFVCCANSYSKCKHRTRNHKDMKAYTHSISFWWKVEKDNFKGGSCKYGMIQDSSRYHRIWKELETNWERKTEETGDLLSIDLYKNRNNVRKCCSVLNTKPPVVTVDVKWSSNMSVGNGFKKNPYEKFCYKYFMMQIYRAKHGVSVTLFIWKFLGPLVTYIRDIIMVMGFSIVQLHFKLLDWVSVTCTCINTS
jgi:hypothetical protein